MKIFDLKSNPYSPSKPKSSPRMQDDSHAYVQGDLPPIGIPTLQEQAKQAMNVQAPTFDPNQPVPPQEEEYDPSNIDHITRGNEYVSALEAILANAKPQIDPEKEKRYKQRAAVTSYGQGLKAIFDAIYHDQGMNVQPDQSQNVTYSNEALAKLQDDYKNKMETYNNMLTQGKLQGLNYREQLRDAADKMKYMWNVNKANNAQKDKEFQFEKEYKTKSLKQDNDQFVKQLAQQLNISEATLKQRKDESDQDHRDRLAAIQAQKENAILDYNASVNRETNKKKKDETIEFINPTTNAPDSISPIAMAHLVQEWKRDFEKGKTPGMLFVEKKKPGSLYNLVTKFLEGENLSKSSLSILMGYIYTPRNVIATRQFSDGDIESATQDIQRGNSKPQPDEEWIHVDAQGNPIKPTSSTPNKNIKIDVSKYGGKIGFGK